MRIVNLAAYRFVSLDAPKNWRAARCLDLSLRGTISLAPGGITRCLAGARGAVDAIIGYLRADPLFEGKFPDLRFRQSLSDTQPFKRMLVKFKREIIALRAPAACDPARGDNLPHA